MFSDRPKNLPTTAAWRISTWTTVAFAIVTGASFFIVYLLFAEGIRQRSDAWLSGEAETLAEVGAKMPLDDVYNKIVGEVAELAAHELPDERNAQGQKLNPVFFLEEDPTNQQSPLWVGPGSKGDFLKAIREAGLKPGIPESITVEGWPTQFRVIARHEGARTTYLGLSSRGDEVMLYTFALRFFLLWSSTVLMGLLISYVSVRRTLLRVESIAQTVAGISSEDLGQRLPSPVTSDEISRLARTFNHMLDRIQSSVNQLRSVTDSVAHDVKSPVTSIRGTLESVLCEKEDGNWRESVGEAIEGLDRLLDMLNTILDVAEAKAGALRLDRSSVNLTEVVKFMVDLYQPAMAVRRHEVVVDLEDHVVVQADVGLLNRVINNLLENELTHLPEGCQVAIRLRSQQGSAELVIEDNGPGFSPEIAARAFERFVKGKQSRGHGLGLAFVDAVVQSHGGAAKISTRPEGGAVIALSWPAGVPQPA
jgi:signal transduction histidine kinase